MTSTSTASAVLTCVAIAALTACGGGGGGGSSGSGTMRLSLTDAPACGFDNAFVTVERVRVHRDAGAADEDIGWAEVVLPSPQRIDLLTLNNGTLLPLGQTELPAGRYTQMRLVLAPNTVADPLANAVTPSGGSATPLTTPSGQQSGLKMNVNLTVPEGEVADFAIDFDACKSFVRAGNSGQIHLKPVLSVIPILNAAGQRIVGFVHPGLVAPTTTISAQVDGAPVRATPPDSDGRFTLYPVPAGTYDLVITAAGRVNAVMTGVPVAETSSTVVGSDSARLSTPASPESHVVSGEVAVDGETAETGASVRATQTLAAGVSIEVGYAAADVTTGAYSLTLPAAAPVRTAYEPAATSFTFESVAEAAGVYALEAQAPAAQPEATDVVLEDDLTVDFVLAP